MSETAPPESIVPQWNSLCQHFVDVFPPATYGRVGIVLAVSGGADSVALSRLVAQSWQESPHSDLKLVTLAHFNHKLRGQESDEDQAFVQELAGQLRVNVVTASYSAGNNEAAPSDVGSSEATLRDHRYRFLRRTVAASGARCLVTAHNADDQVETVLHHLFRGTGPAGMCGIPIRRQLDQDFMLIRPLITVRGERLRDGLREIGQTWREDHTNSQLNYSRNWIRRELLPLIRTRYHNADDAILRLVDAQGGWHQMIAREAKKWSDLSVTVAGDCAFVSTGPVELAVVGLAITMLWDRMQWPRRDLGAGHFQAIHSMLTQQSKVAITLPGDIHAGVECDSDGHAQVSFRRITRRR